MKLLTWMSTIPLILILTAAATDAGERNDNDKILTQRLADLYELNLPEYEIEVRSNRLGEVDLSSVEFEFEALTRRDPLGLFTVAVNLSDTNGKSRSGQVRFYIHRYQEVLVLLARVRRSHEVSADKIELQRTEITTLKERPLVDLDQLVGKRAARNLRKGAILTSNCLEQIPDIESGREISIVITDGACRIVAGGVALQNGVAGDYIKVKNSSSGKILVARVVDSRAVAIDL